MPSYEAVTPRAGRLRAMTGLTAQEFTALLPPFEHAWLAYMEDHTRDGQRARAAAPVRMRPRPYPRWRISCSSS